MASIGSPLLEMVPPGIALVTLNRPEVLNALRHEDILTLINLVTGLSDELDTRVVVLTGAGRAFCAGGDLRALRRMGPTETGPYLASYSELAEAFSSLRVPVIAALNGPAFGGGLELACMADIRVAGEGATLCAADLPMGLVPTGGLTWVLPRLVGHGRASWMLLSNATVTAREAALFGLCDVVVAEGAALQEALQLARAIADCPPAGVAATKHALGLSNRLSPADSRAFEVEVNQQLLWDEAVRRRLHQVLPDRDSAG